MTLAVLHRDRHFLVVAKPPGLPTTSPAAGDSLARRVHVLDPDAPRLHPSSRLDADVSGVVTFARTRRATKALLAARKRGAYERLYLALCARAPEPGAGRWERAIARDAHDPRKRVVCDDPGEGQPAATDYRTAAQSPHACLLFLWPQTGRTHQLRVHAAGADVPLLGDRPYGGPGRVVLPDGRTTRLARVMLHCARVRVPDPDGSGCLTFLAPAPDDLVATWTRLGGDPAALSALPD